MWHIIVSNVVDNIGKKDSSLERGCLPRSLHFEQRRRHVIGHYESPLQRMSIVVARTLAEIIDFGEMTHYCNRDTTGFSASLVTFRLLMSFLWIYIPPPRQASAVAQFMSKRRKHLLHVLKILQISAVASVKDHINYKLP